MREGKMQRFYSDRETHGPEFDNRLIQLVRDNPAIYDVNHPHYRRNPVRVSIWDHIAKELGAPSKFLQTKWKNIRYNYLQEIKCLETGHSNVNIRKRRFTEDLSFLQNTAQSYNVKKGMPGMNKSFNGSDDSNSYLYPDPQLANNFEVIVIENSNDGCPKDHVTADGKDDYDNQVLDEMVPIAEASPEAHAAGEPYQSNQYPPRPDYASGWECNSEYRQSPTQNDSPSPLLTPIVTMSNGDEDKDEANGETEKVTYAAKKPSKILPASKVMENATTRKSMPVPFPALTPINDPTELYCLSLVDSLRNMPRCERERVKYEFAKILKDAKYKD